MSRRSDSRSNGVNGRGGSEVSGFSLGELVDPISECFLSKCIVGGSMLAPDGRQHGWLDTDVH